MIMRTLTAVVATCVGVLVVQSAQATLLFSEAFNYSTAADLSGQVNPGNSTAWSGGNSSMTIGNGNLTYPGLVDLGGNELSLAWGSSSSSINTFSAVNSGQIYYSFLLDMTTGSGGNDYLTSLNPGTTTPNGGSDAINIYIDGGHANALRLRTAGVSEFSSGSSPTLSLDTTYLVVMEYDFATTTANLWLDPTLGGSQPAVTETLAGDGSVTGIANVGFKNQSTTGDFLIDNLRVGTTWADVTPTPEPSTLALAGLGLLGLVFARRKRR